MNAELIIFAILLIFGLLVFLVWLARELQRTKDSLKIDTLEANEEVLQKHLRQTQQQERLKNMSVSELDTILDKLHRNKENNPK